MRAANSSSAGRHLSIGEFAGATQLSPKALRLYDEHGLLQPARIDATTGYRYYSRDQVPLGRLIRTLRDMGLPLSDIGRVVAVEGARAEALLREFATDLDHRYAREKRAFKTALLLLRDANIAEPVIVEAETRPAMTAVVRTFTADRRHFFERLRNEGENARVASSAAGLRSLEEIHCRLLDPLSDDDAQLELLWRVEPPPSFPDQITLRQLPSASCAVVRADTLNLQSADFSAPLDAIFDWFDRRGCRALDTPWLSRVSRDGVQQTLVSWAYEQDASQPR